jgi:predicted protein tyrosine phosphatase
MHRSPTAAKLFTEFETRAKGLYTDNPVTAADLEWADVVAVMEPEQRHELGKRFPTLYLQKRIVCLDVSDSHSYGSPELIAALEQKRELLMPVERVSDF